MMNENLKLYLEKTKESKLDYWKVHYPKLSSEKKLNWMESKVAQCKRQLDKTLSLLNWLLGIQVLGLGYFIWGWFGDTIDFNGSILPYYFFLVFLPTFAAWRNASEFGEDWDEPFGGRESESWQRWFKRKHQHGGKDVL